MPKPSKALFDLSAFVAQQMAAIEADPTPRYDSLPAGAFPAPSLTAWLRWAQAAGVPAVPATEVARLPVADLLGFDTESPEAAVALGRVLALNAGRPSGTMLRWDCCAPMGLKWHMGEGNPGCPTDPSSLDLHPGDPRAFDILYEFPDDEVAVHQRPWVDAQVHEGFPVEFRVFVHQGQVVGVSNYYVQRPLPASEPILASALLSANAAGRMIAAMKAAGAFPWVAHPRSTPIEVQQGVEATLDFLVAPTGQVLFLEAGPGAGLGAHPCCFHNPETHTVAPIDGLRLDVNGPTLPLPSTVL